MNLSDKDDAQLVAYCEAIKELVRPHAEELAKVVNITQKVALMRLLKPYFRGGDARQKKWTVKIYMWESPLNGELSDSELLWEAEPEVVDGMMGVAELVRNSVHTQHRAHLSDIEGAGKMSGNKPFTSQSLLHHLEKMRPAFSRGGGSASTRWFYTDSGRNYMLQADIERLEEETT